MDRTCPGLEDAPPPRGAGGTERGHWLLGGNELEDREDSSWTSGGGRPRLWGPGVRAGTAEGPQESGWPWVVATEATLQTQAGLAPSAPAPGRPSVCNWALAKGPV